MCDIWSFLLALFAMYKSALIVSHDVGYHFSLSESKIIQKLILFSWYRNPAQFGDTPPHRERGRNIWDTSMDPASMVMMVYIIHHH